MIEEGMNDDGTRNYDVTPSKDIVVDSNIIICPNCQGYGEKTVSYRENFYETSKHVTKCSLCNGRGTLIKTNLVRYRTLMGDNKDE